LTDARAKILLVLFASVLAVVLERTGSLAVLASACTAAAVLGRRSWRDLATMGLLIGGIAWSTALSQGLFYGDHPRTPWLTLGPVVLWREGLVYGGTQALRWTALGMAGLAFASSTSPDRALAGLVQLGVPAPLAFVVATALRAVGDLGQVWLEVRRARAARGRPVWARDPVSWLRLEVEMVGPVVGRASRRARMLARTLEARGYVAGATRSEPPRPTAWFELALTAGVGATTLSLVVLRVVHALYLAEILYIPAFRPLYAAIRAWM
jgi:energy-coupling factor transport system permease protein